MTHLVCVQGIFGIRVVFLFFILFFLARNWAPSKRHVFLQLFDSISMRGEGAPGQVGRPGSRSASSGVQGTYLACLPARNIQPSDSPSTWARPAPTR
jgi:hypothetical protein